MTRRLSLSFVAAATVLVVVNQVQIVTFRKNMQAHAQMMEQIASDASPGSSGTITSQQLQVLAQQLLPHGVPQGYGEKLNVSFDDPAAAIDILAPLEQDTRARKLTGKNLERYVAIGMRASCEFCCGAKTLVFQNGSKACGCAHSAAMRGVIAYLLEAEGTKLTDQQILTEANKWKAVFFPGPTVNRYLSATGQSVQGGGLQQQVGGC